MDKWLTIEQTADMLGLSKDTIRRRIRSKEIVAEKQVGNYGLQWMVDADKLNKAMQAVDVAQVSRAVSVAELETAVTSAIAKVVRDEIQPLKEQLEKQQEMLDNHYRLIDERLREVSRPKSLWQRILEKYL